MKYLGTLAACVFFSAHGASESLKIDNVITKITAKNSLQAKQVALESATKRAFARLLNAHYPEAGFLQNKVSYEQLQPLITDYSVEQEKFSGKIYIAEFSFRFSEQKVVKFLNEHGIAEKSKQTSEAKIAIYTDEYLNYYGLFRGYDVLVFSAQKMILKAGLHDISELKSRNIRFVKL